MREDKIHSSRDKSTVKGGEGVNCKAASGTWGSDRLFYTHRAVGYMTTCVWQNSQKYCTLKR